MRDLSILLAALVVIGFICGFVAAVQLGALSANPPPGVTGGPDWWKTWYFSDGFHPTPYAHQLTFQLISRALTRAGWL